VTDPVLLGSTERLVVIEVEIEEVGDLLEETDPHTLEVPEFVLETEEDPDPTLVDVSLTTLLIVIVDTPDLLREGVTLELTDLLVSIDPDTDGVPLRDHETEPVCSVDPEPELDRVDVMVPVSDSDTVTLLLTESDEDADTVGTAVTLDDANAVVESANVAVREDEPEILAEVLPEAESDGLGNVVRVAYDSVAE
jgi:hypothetical protein